MTEPSLQSAVEEFMQSPENQCFACGPGNPYGLQLHFHREDGVTWAEFVPARWHEGWQGVVHGGIVTTLLDEAMAYTLFFDGYQALTARLQVRFRSAVRRDDHLRVEARILNERRNLVDISARVRRGEEIVAEADARFVKMGQLARPATTLDGRAPHRGTGGEK